MSCATPNTRDASRRTTETRIKNVKACCSCPCAVLSIVNSRIRSSSYSLYPRTLAKCICMRWSCCKRHTSNGFNFTERIPNQLGFSIGRQRPNCTVRIRAKMIEIDRRKLAPYGTFFEKRGNAHMENAIRGQQQAFCTKMNKWLCISRGHYVHVWVLQVFSKTLSHLMGQDAPLFTVFSSNDSHNSQSDLLDR